MAAMVQDLEGGRGLPDEQAEGGAGGFGVTRRSYRLLAFVVTLVVIYGVNAAGWLSDVTLVEGLLWAPVCFFGTAFFILGLERVLGIAETDNRS